MITRKKDVLGRMSWSFYHETKQDLSRILRYEDNIMGRGERIKTKKRQVLEKEKIITGSAKFMATHILTWFSNKNEEN